MTSTNTATVGPLNDRVVLVTGAAKRVGAALARGFHAQGARVAIHFHRSFDAAQSLQQSLNAQRADSAILVQADLLDPAIIPNIVATTIARFGRLDVLINNASSFYATPLGSISLEQWDDLVGTNLKAPLFLSRKSGGDERLVEL